MDDLKDYTIFCEKRDRVKNRKKLVRKIILRVWIVMITISILMIPFDGGGTIGILFMTVVFFFVFRGETSVKDLVFLIWWNGGPNNDSEIK